MRSFEATSIIAASPEKVWAILTDMRAWPSWGSGVVRVKGRLEVGARVEITSEGKAGKGFPFKVTEVEPGERLVLTGSARLGLFTGVRTYLVTTKSRGARFRMREEYHGRMAAMVVQSMPDMTDLFQQFADGLKGQAEASGRAAEI